MHQEGNDVPCGGPINTVQTLRNRWEPGAIVAAVWAACTLALIGGTTIYGPRLPFSDDWVLVPIITKRAPLTLGWLWAQHSEHRIVIPKLAFIILYRATSANFRSVIYLNIVLLSLLSAASILTMRTIRGRILLTDAFYPLLLMHLGLGAFFWGSNFSLP